MNRIRLLDPAADLAVCEAGVILAHLHEAALAAGRRFPLSLARGSATIGGLVSTNAGGTQVLRFGTMRQLVQGLEAVLPDGSLFEGLSPLKKDNRGYSLTQLLIGAEGTLGIVTAASLRLVPAIGERVVAWVGLETPQAAPRLLHHLETLVGDAVESFELVPASSLALVLDHVPETRAPLAAAHPWNVLVEAVAPMAAAESPETALYHALRSALETGSPRTRRSPPARPRPSAVAAARQHLEAEKKDVPPPSTIFRSRGGDAGLRRRGGAVEAPPVFAPSPSVPATATSTSTSGAAGAAAEVESTERRSPPSSTIWSAPRRSRPSTASAR